MWLRFFGMILIAATFYSFEIPSYFDWIERRTEKLSAAKKSLAKTCLALIYFNPLWVARHLLFIKLFSANFAAINLKLLEIASISFLVNIPFSFVANHIIQNKIELKWRFLASAVFSAIMAVYYALSENLFG